MLIEIDFDVWKALTLKRESEEISNNDVLRAMLGLPQPLAEPEPSIELSKGRVVGGRFLPDGTKLRAKYKSIIQNAFIRDGQWQDELGDTFPSASAAARAITGNTVNGLTFWEAKRPTDREWRKLSALPKASI